MNKRFQPKFAFFDDNGINIAFNCGSQLIKVDYYNNEELLVNYFAKVWNVDVLHSMRKIKKLMANLSEKPVAIPDSAPALIIPETSVHTVLNII